MARKPYYGSFANDSDWTPIDETESLALFERQPTLVADEGVSTQLSYDKLLKRKKPYYQRIYGSTADACYEKCQHLMSIGHGNEYRGCYRRCMGQNLDRSGL